MDSIASPYQEGLMPAEHAGYLETFRGCPLSCTFCQWGVLEADRFFSTDYMVRELAAIDATRPLCIYLIDAALNLHPRAFRNLVAAEREVGLLRHGHLLCEVYPTHLRDEHLEFLAEVGAVHVGLGVQSLDPEVLRTAERPFKPERLRAVVEQLREFGLVDIEIILGLPGDTPERFKRTLEGVLELPCSVRVYRCLILPDGLMTRAAAGADLRFDPLTLEMQSCASWPEHELRATQDYLTELAGSHPDGALVGDYWWLFLGGTEHHRRAYPTVARPAGAAIA
jgi:Radical SAM superfamily